MTNPPKSIFEKVSAPFVDFFRAIRITLEQSDRNLYQQIQQRQSEHANPFVRYGEKCFSQSDEDGITLEIIRRLGLEKGCFAEFGVGDGMENNTLILAASGWSGFWVGGEDLAVDVDRSRRLTYTKAWITRDNIAALCSEGTQRSQADELDVVSLDLDGNDIYLAEALLTKGHTPKLFIVEYNAKFPPPVRFAIDYDANHQWQRDDYFGASLCSFADLFAGFDYSLICCNAATGANAFFVRNEYRQLFPEAPDNINDIYTPPHYFEFSRYGHKRSVRLVEKILMD